MDGVTDEADDRELPPGQELIAVPKVKHYGPVPKFRPATWRFTVNGATADGQDHHLDHDAVMALPRTEMTADFHCASKWSVRDRRWSGISSKVILDLVPPAPDVTHVMAWAEYGYSANMRLADFSAEGVLLAVEENGAPLTPEHGFPLRLVVPHLYSWKGPKWLRAVEYLTEQRRGFWEERGYHVNADPWREERYSYLE